MKIRSGGTMMFGAVIIAVSVIISVMVFTDTFQIGNNNNHHQDKIRVAYFPNVGHLIPIVGIEKGIFEKHMPNVQIETRLFDSGPQVIESFFANSIDIAYVGPGPAITGFLNSENNTRLKILSGAASGGASFLVHPDSLEDDFSFDGKKIAAPQIGNTQDVSLRNYLSENNLRSAEKGGTVIVYSIANPDIYTLFLKGDVDGAWVAEPWATILEKELGGTRLFYEEELWPNNEFASVLLVANTNYVEKNPEIIRLWLQAHNDTIRWINAKNNSSDTGQIFNDFMADAFGRGLNQNVVDISLTNIEITSDPIPESIHLFAQRANDLGYLGRNGYNLSGIFYNMDLISNLEEEEEKEDNDTN